MTRCLNCYHDRIPTGAQVCPRCGIHLPSLTRQLLPFSTKLKKDRYRIASVQGRGLFGVTYRAVDDVSGQDVAIKEFFPVECAVRHEQTLMIEPLEEHLESYQRALGRFLHEGRIIARLNHPGVVQVIDIFEECGTVYWVMEFIGARSLALELYQMGQLEEERAVPIIKALVGALDALHQAGIFHLDVAPAHVLLSGDGRVVLGDFAGPRRELGALRSRAYNPAYAPPEVMIDRHPCGPESDVFALGMIIHEMLTGRKAPQALERWLEGGGWGVDGLPERWQSLIRGALALRREDRPNAIKTWWRSSFPEFDNKEDIEQDVARLEEEGEWHELIEVLDFRATLERDSEVALGLRYRIASVWDETLDEPERAVDAYQEVLALKRSHAPSLDALERLYRLLERWPELLELYDMRLSLAEEESVWVELYCKAGRVFETYLKDEEGAIESYKRALLLVPHHPGAFVEIERLYRSASRWSDLLLMYKTLARTVKDVETGADIQCEIGQIFEESLENLQSAEKHYRRALDLKSSCVPAIQALSRLYTLGENWEQALRMLQLENKHTEEETEKALLFHKIGVMYQNLDDAKSARQSFEKGLQLDSTSVENGAALARSYLADASWAQAVAVLNLQIEHATSDDALFVFYGDRARCHEALTEFEQAQDDYTKAHELKPDHVDTLEALIALHRGQSNWKEMIRFKLRKASLGQDPEGQFNLLNDIGDVWRDHLNDVSRAVEVYNAALKLQPDALVVLHKKFDLYAHHQQWPEAIKTLKALALKDVDQAPTHQQTIANIYWDELGDAAGAVESLTKALMIEPTQPGAFEAVERILTKTKDWPKLERAYRKVLHRIRDMSELDDLKLQMWKDLGRLYRDRLENEKGAIAAWKVATALSPDDPELSKLLAGMYANSNSHHKEALLEHRKSLAEAVRSFQIRIPSLRGLFNAYMHLERFDEAWCVASALSFLHQATEDEEQFYQRYLEKVELRPANARISPEQWRSLYHKNQDRLVSNIMGLIAVHMRKYYALTRWDWGAHKRDKVDLEQRMPFCRIYRTCAETVGVDPPPDVFLLKKEGQSGLVNGNINPPAFIVGVDMFQGRTDYALTFFAGRHLTLARPEHYLGSGFFPAGNLLVFYLAAMQIAEPALDFTQDHPAVADVLPKMQKKIPRPVLTQLQGLAARKLKMGRNFGGDISAWREAIDHTSNRVGMLLCGDLHAAMDAIKTDLVMVSDATLNDRIREMVLFWISEEHFDLRKQLGLALG